MRKMIALALLLTACNGATSQATPSPSSSLMAVGDMQLTSTSFPADGAIPARYTCDDAGTSPALAWTGLPAGTTHLALICHDPDAPAAGGFTHWVLYDIPASAPGIAEGSEPVGSVEGANGRGANGYTGPCPPQGPAHHYHFTLYALSGPLGLAAGATEAQVKAAVAGKTLGQAELVGTYARKAS